MEEKKLIEGAFIKNSIFYPFAITMIGLLVLLVIIPELAGFRSFEFSLFLPIFSVVIVVSWIVFFYAKNCAITITNKRVYGKAAFGRRVDLPIDSVSAIGTSWLKGVVISSSSGKISFLLISNRDEIYESINSLLISRQTSMPNRAFVGQEIYLSNTEELKNYKELLDMGAITQEEFDTKKKRLLDL